MKRLMIAGFSSQSDCSPPLPHVAVPLFQLFGVAAYIMSRKHSELRRRKQASGRGV